MLYFFEFEYPVISVDVTFEDVIFTHLTSIKMERYTLQEIIKIHYKNGEKLAETVRKTQKFLGRREAPCQTAIKKLVEKFELLGQVCDVKNKTRARRLITAENIASVAERLKQK